MNLDHAAIEKVFEDISPDAPGCAVGVVQNGELVFAKGFGSANLELGVPITPDSVFDIASTSKQFTAATVLSVADDGLLSLDDPVTKHVPALPMDVFGAITIRQLIHHTSGIPDYTALIGMSGRTWNNDYQEDELVDLIAGQRGLDFEPGTSYSYSNSGYFLLSEVVRAVTGQSLRVEADKRLFGTAGMAATFFHDDYTEVVPNRATAYAPHADGWSIDVPIIDVLGDGAVFTTVRDLARWDEQFYNCTLRGGADFMERLQQPGSLNDGTEIGYAFGLFVDTLGSLRRIRHGGAWGGYRTQLVRYPEVRTSVIVLANSGNAPITQYESAVTKAVLGDLVAEDTAEQGSVPFDLGDRAGRYVDERATMVLRLETDDDGNTVVRVGPVTIPLKAVGPDTLSGRPLTETEIALRTTGELQLNTTHRKSLRLVRLVEDKPGPGELTPLAGTYRSDELSADFRIVAEGDVLRARIEWLEWLTLRPLGSDIFEVSGDSFDAASGLVIRFERDAGEPVAVTLGYSRARPQRYTRVE